ncbi:hybrid sensor histidine kinase/response regulator transcription factor [Flectobacillus longus]|uniref:hybrid sensor histidine kinase/response regulator transcription factor n=1 Tax=Flectobacillus longus TaxID=2984207 RepID=UPI0024B6F528|nr:hybrid sensor histidine kinase/response regulator transcription factor [Flectobacillus longus]MDI9879293.1 two-component regulator propeller domain-containing protein [Flectobacillus longus]
MAQSFSFRHYEVEDNLSYNSVMCSMQDSKGFLWFGTKDGLNRFDGYSFKVFRKIENNPKSLGNNTVFSICEGDQQTIWVGTYAGIYQYNTITEQFSLLPDTKEHFIRTIKTDDEGNVWFIKDYTLQIYNPKTHKTERLDTGKERIDITSFILNKQQIWLATTDGNLWEYNTLSKSLKKYNMFEKSAPAISHWIDKIYDTKQNAILIGTSSQGVKLFNTKTKTYEDILTYNSNKTAIYVRDFMHRTEDEYWIATESGLYIYYLQARKYINLKHEYSNPYSISDNALYTLSKDREGGIWIGTYFGGINYLPTQHVAFDKYFNQGANNSITGNAVREICEDKFGNLWIGTEDNGLNKLNLKTRQFTHFKPDGKPNSLSHSNIHGLMTVGDKLWVGAFESGLDILDIPSGKVVKHFVAGNGPRSLKSNFVETLYRTKSNMILVATSNGLFRFHEKTQDFTPLCDRTTYGHFITVTEDKEGNIWTGTTREGLRCIDFKHNRAVNFRSSENDTTSISCNAINGIFIDHANRIWVTTENGLNLLDRKTGKFRRFGTKDGFPSDVFYKILEDQHHKLWISTSKGLCAYDFERNKLATYTKSNGILSDQFNYSSAFKDDEGRMYFGSVKGLNSFTPDTFMQNAFVPPVYLTGIQVDNQELKIGNENSPLERSISFTKSITLDHTQSTFSLDFAALSYTSPQTTEYMYMLEGLDKGWNLLKTNRKVYFTKLAPGSYTFKVKASNGSGIWSEEMAVLEIEVSPPFWASGIAYILYSIVILLAIYFGIQMYHEYINQQNQRKIDMLEIEKEKEIYAAKIEFFTNVTHEIRTPLTLIKAPLEDLIKKNTENNALSSGLQVIEKNTDRLLELTNQLLDFRKTEANGFSLNFVKMNISQFLQERFEEFYPMATFKQISFELQLPNEDFWASVDREAFQKIISNLIDNAVKYAEHKAIIKLYSIDETHFSIEVQNDGLLIPEDYRQRIFEPFYRMNNVKNQRGTGIGLALARSLAELHDGVLKVIDSKNMNIFLLELPIHHAYEFDIRKEVVSVSSNNIPQKISQDERPTILLVEDNYEIAQFIGEKLEENYHILRANNGQVALELIESESVQLVLSDVMMPIMDGFELCKYLKSNQQYSHIPVILLTAKNTLQAKIVGLELGADAYIEKPFSLDYLLMQISNLLINRTKVKDYFANSPLVHLKNMAHSKSDEAFLEKITEIIFQNLDNNQLDVDLLAETMNMSRPTLYRKIKSVANLSPNELIIVTRLKKAAELLVQSDYKIQTIASMTGFNSQAQFGRSFLKQFGIRPSEYAKKR